MTQRPHAIHRPPAALPTVHYARDYRATLVAAEVRSGRWIRVARGAYVSHDPDEEVHDRRRRVALAKIVALATGSSSGRWISHTSAALLWGLPLYGLPTRTHVIQLTLPSSTTGSRARVLRHVHDLATEDRALCQGIPVTSVARTVIDCARSARPTAALVIADGALNGHVDVEVLNRLLAAMGSRPGLARAREILALADAGAESPGETLLRIALLRGGLPAPETQVAIDTRLGTFWADLGWLRWRIAVEYDGRSKYGPASPDAFMREKRRHDAIVEAGWTILRVTKEDLASPGSLIARVRRQFPAGTPADRVPRVLRLPTN